MSANTKSLILPTGIQYEDLHKVTVRINGATHVASPWLVGFTLCGLKWWYQCDLGSDYYCRRCQVKLSKIKAANT